MRWEVYCWVRWLRFASSAPKLVFSRAPYSCTSSVHQPHNQFICSGPTCSNSYTCSTLNFTAVWDVHDPHYDLTTNIKRKQKHNTQCMGNHTGSRNECRHLVSPTHALFAGSQGPWRAQVWVCLFVPLGVLKKLINTKTSPEIYSDGDQSQEHKHNTTSSTSFFLLLHKLFVMAFSLFFLD